jgi:hypothetical protein
VQGRHILVNGHIGPGIWWYVKLPLVPLVPLESRWCRAYFLVYVCVTMK